MLERITSWTDSAGRIIQVSVCRLSDDWEELGEVTERVARDEHAEVWIEFCRGVLDDLGVGSQLALFDGV